MKHIILLPLGLVLALLSCSKEEEEGNEGFKQEIVYSDDLKGEWQWVESGGGFFPVGVDPISTPLSTGRTESVIISSDSIFFLIDNKLYNKYPYQLVRGIPVCLNDSVDFIKIDTTTWNAQDYKVQHDSLWLIPICIADAGYKLYRRN